MLIASVVTCSSPKVAAVLADAGECMDIEWPRIFDGWGTGWFIFSFFWNEPEGAGLAFVE